MEDTWTNRDLPVLETVVRLLDDGKTTVAVGEIAAETGFKPAAVDRALTALKGDFIVDYHQSTAEEDLNTWHVTQVTSDARRAVGQWPKPESMISAAIYRAKDLAKRTVADK